MSPNFEKRNVSLKLSSGEMRALDSAMTAIEGHIGKVADVWLSVSDRQRRQVLERSPILSRFLDLAERVVR